MNNLKTLLVLLAFFLFGEALAQDYVDVINQSSKPISARRVIYELNVGAFTQEGTFKAAQQRLSELKTLGVDIVWLMPIYPRGGGINSPYAAKNFQQVNSAYGSIDDLRNLVKRAHELNMLVWLDWVPNHTATDADWVSQHPDYYTRQNGQMVHPNGYGDVFELNYNNQSLRNAMTDCLKFWIDQADVDGYRCDYVASPTIPNTYWQSAISTLKNYKGKNIEFLAESNLTWDHYLDNVNVGFSYDYAWSFQTDLVNMGGGTSAQLLKDLSNKMIDASKPYNFARMVYITNHDQNYNESKKTLSQKYGSNKYLFTVLFQTLYGMPLIYNGQEIGGDQALNYFTDEKVNWNNTDYKMRNTMRTLCALRHSEAALEDKVGVNWLNTNNGNVLAYTRKKDNSEVLVILNLGDGQNTVNISGLSAGTWSQWLNSDNIAQGVSRTQQNFNSTQSFTLSGRGYAVYVRDGGSSEPITPNPTPEAYIPYLDNANEVSFFFETRNQADYTAWAWDSRDDGGIFINNGWPGDALQLKGQNADGAYIYKFTFTKTNDVPAYLIISKQSGNSKIYDGITFVNHGYYVEGRNESTQTITAVGAPQTIVITSYVKGDGDWQEASELTIEEGHSFSSGPQANGNPGTPGTWSWRGPDGFTSDEREITIDNVTIEKGGTYTVTFKSTSGAQASADITVRVLKPLTITPFVSTDYEQWSQDKVLTVDPGASIWVGPQANGNPYTAGSWKWTGPNGFTSDKREFSITNITADNAGTYTATFTDEYERTVKLDIVVTVNAPEEPEPSGINGVKADKNTVAIYDLSGKKVAKSAKTGVYITGGRKVVLNR